MVDSVITERLDDYPTLSEHIRGRSYRELARRLGRSHEHWRQRCAEESDGLVAECEEHLRAGRAPLFQVPYGQPLNEYAAALTLSQHTVDQLRGRGWRVHAQGVRIDGWDGVAFEIVEEEP